MTAIEAKDETRTDAFKSFLSAVNRYITELYRIAEQASSEQPGTAELLRAFADQQAGTALELVGIWPPGGVDRGW